MFTKEMDQLNISDIESLVSTTRLSENERIEYKKTLPSTGSQEDPWIEGADRIGETALKKITAEIVALSNTHGGTIIIGIEEDGCRPPRPSAINFLPRCEALEQKLMQSISSRIEPNIDGLLSKAIIADSGEGVIVISVPRSEHAPHRSKTDKEFYYRERDECKKMTPQQIKSLAVKRSRQKVEALWTIKFRMHDSSDVNGGVLILSEGKIYGGDSGYYYHGIYELINENKISGYVHITNYHGESMTAFGTDDNEMSLIIKGDLVENDLSGQIYDINTNWTIPYIMKKKRELL